jgi:hypothetical protein
VLDRCDAAGEVRAPSGECKQLDDCSAECNGGQGRRDEILGVCTCEDTLSTDQTCNQDCRQSAPVAGFTGGSASQLTVTDPKTGKVSNLDLNKVGDVFGAPTGSGNLRTVSLSSTGYEGSYNQPAAFDAGIEGDDEDVQAETVLTATGERRTRIVKRSTARGRRQRRSLQDTANSGDQFSNPLYCLNEGDNFMFNIENPQAYPQYKKDSTLNSNLNFDYGSFQDLKIEMERKQNDQVLSASIFTFTFVEAGNYVFELSNDPAQMMVISVKGPGESCADPDRYLQVMSGESLAAFGVSQRTDIIIQPNYPLLVSMLFIGVFGTGFVLWMVYYCMHKGWNIKEMKTSSYRDQNMHVNVHHENERVFVNNNDFIKHKAEDFDHEEEELDNCNLDIQQDLVDAGKKYLNKYNKRK